MDNHCKNYLHYSNIMFVQSAVLACALAIASAAWNGPLAGGVPAASVPAGISPQACPNYPHCTNPSVAAEPNAPAPAHGYHNQGYQPQYQAQPQYQYQPQYQHQPQYNHAPAHQYNQNALDSGEYTGDGDYRGEGLAESGAFGPVDDPQSYDRTPAYQAAPAYQHAPAYPAAAGYQHAPAHQQPAQLPAGVDAHSCPNYPYCS